MRLLILLLVALPAWATVVTDSDITGVGSGAAPELIDLVDANCADGDTAFWNQSTGKFECDAPGAASMDYSVEVDSSLIPDTDDTYDIGNATDQFQDGFFDGTLEADAITENGTALSTKYTLAPASTTDNRMCRFDGTAGQIQQTGITVDDSDNITGVVGITATTFTGRLSIGTSQAAVGNGLTNTAGTDNVMFYTGSALRGSVGPAGAWTIGTAAGTETHAVNGTLAATVAITSGGVAVPTISSSSTLTNKTIDSDDNSISDLNTGDIKAGDNLLKRDFCVHIRTGADETIFLVLDASEPFSANSVTADLTSGSITMAVQNEGASLTSCSAISVTTTETETDCTDTAVTADEDLTLVFSSNSSATGIRVCVHGVKT